MKKTITILLLLSCFVVTFAETGYAGKQWMSKSSDLPYLEADEDTKMIDKKMLGIDTTVYYHFSAKRLMAVSYSLPISKTEQAKSNYKNLVDTYKLEVLTQTKWKVLLISGNKINSESTTDDIDRASNKAIYLLARGIELNNVDKIDNGDARIYIYDYNDDTRVYLFENVVKGVLFVVYTHHEQDF